MADAMPLMSLNMAHRIKAIAFSTSRRKKPPNCLSTFPASVFLLLPIVIPPV